MAWSALLRNSRGASAAEFALVLPLLLLFILGLIDAGRWMWELNQQEKAVQAAVRYAVVTDPVIDGLDDYEFALDPSTPVTQGEPVPATYWSQSVCTSTACTCNGSECGSISTSRDADAFDNILEQVRNFYSLAAPGDLTVRYENVGLGYSGNPNGADISPMVTVELDNLTFTPLFFQLFSVGSLPMPNMTAAMTGEDLSGSVSN